MKTMVLLFALTCGSVLQALLPTWHALGQAHLPLLLSIVLYYALTHARSLMWVAAVGAGLLQDALGPIPLGYSSFCFCLAAWGVGRFREVLFARELLTRAVFSALSAAGVTVVLYVLLLRDGSINMRPGWMALKVVGSLMLGAVTAPAVFRALEHLDRMLGNLVEDA